MGRLVQVIENQTSWNGSTVGKSTYPMYQTAYSYDPLDDLLGVNQSGQTRSFTCDWLKRLLTSNNPETGLISYNYDKINNLTTKKDNRGITTTLLNYDGLNRPQQKTYSDGVTPTVTYCYDGQTSGCSAATESAGQMLGHLTYVGNSSSFTQFTNFLPRGLVGSSTQTTGLPSFPLPTLAFSYTYSLTEKLLPETYPSGKVVSTSYDLDDRIAGVTGPAGAYATLNATPSLAYTPDGKIENFTYGSPLTESRSYDANTLLPTGVQITKGSTQLLQLGFGYAASPQNNGNIISQTISAPSPDLPGTLTQAYQYDQVNRIVSLSETGGSPSLSQTYAYDAFGNMATTVGALTTQPDHTPTLLSGFVAASGQNNNQWVTACSSAPCYDDGGNQLSVAGDVYSYDAENRMTSANAQNMGPTDYGYDGASHRVWKTNIGASTVYAYDASGELIAEYSTGAPATAGTQYLSTDTLGTTRLITSNTGSVAERYDYVPFGQEIPEGVDGRGPDYGTGVFPSSPDVQSIKFTGKERDAESGNDYFGARYYGSNMGRFLSPDWAEKPEDVPYADLENPQSLNLYSYVNNNPLSKADKDGHCAEDFCVVEGSVTAYFAGAAVLAGASAYLSTPSGQRSLDTCTSAAGASFSSSFHSLTSLFSKGSKDAPAPAAEGDKTNTGPKAATAPGVTAGGQATDQYGNKIGPSGKTQVDQVDHSGKKGAKDAARNEGKGDPEKHPSPTKGDPHYHPTDANGDKVPNSTHHNYPN